jgi:D-alanyl-D-alanine carboxypeptidase
VAGPLAGTPLTLVPSDGETAAPLPRPEPLARDSGIIMVSVRPEAVIPAAPETEVITRLSTSGGPAWTVDLGRFTTRDAAERALLRAALAEIGTLDAAERRVRQTGGAWEARFTGLTAATAALACQRLAARGTACTPDAPGS